MRILNANIFLAICFSTIVKLNRFVSAIACYKCSTLDNDKVCVDPFNPGLTQDNLLESTCYAGMDGRTGLFPAGFCLKITGTVQTTGEQLTIRTCTVHRLLDADGSTSAFNLQVNDTTSIGVVNGYIANCDTDACNQAKSICHLTLLAPISALLFYTLLTFFF